MTITEPYSINEFEQLFRQHYKLLCNAANKIINDREAAEDVVQEVFVKLWNKRNELGVIQSLKSYLFRATINTALNYLETRKNILPLEAVGNIESSGGAGDKVQYNELERKLAEAIEHLPPKCKAIFILSRYEGMKYQQIADHLDISVKTVENQMGKALQMLRERLRPFLTREFISIATGIAIATILGLLSFLLIIQIL
jgi:RNA polymerase sigma-70 factor, ECF subfamily